MAFHENLTEYGGKTVTDFKAPGDIADFGAVAPRLRCDYDDKQTLSDYLALLLDQPGSDQITALVIGVWKDSYDLRPDDLLERLVARKEGLPNLRALFIGDIISEENEISWIKQGNQAILWDAFPSLEVFGVRGGDGLKLGKVRHAALKSLLIQTGGLPVEVTREALAAEAPLEHLELWIGDEGYGRTTNLADLEPLLSGALFPQLQVLGLCDCEYADELAERLASSPLMDRISKLDLSRGNLTDKGAEALIASGKLGGLTQFDITFHYVTPAMVARLQLATPCLIADEPQEADIWDGEPHYYVAVSE